MSWRASAICSVITSRRTKAGDLMKDFSRGVSYYTFGRVDIGFPEDDICCFHCLLLGKDDLGRLICKKTGEVLVSAKFGVGTNCPIQFAAISTEDGAEPENKNEGAKISWELPF